MIAFRSCLGLWIVSVCSLLPAEQTWTQYKFDSQHSGNAPDRDYPDTARPGRGDPVNRCGVHIAGRRERARIFRSGWFREFFTASTRRVCRCRWRFASDGGELNCNNYCSPVLIGDYVHFGTMAGDYYVLDADQGEQWSARLPCGDPIFSCPVVGHDTVYFATLGSRVFAVSPDGQVRWQWDYVQEVLKFDRGSLGWRTVGTLQERTSDLA